MAGDAAWFASLVDADLTDASRTRASVGEVCAEARDLGLHGVVVHPTHVGSVPDGLVATCVVGFPLGKNETLVKAAEARLAVQMGAEAIWLSLDTAVSDANALVAEIVAVRQAVPEPVELAVVADHAAAARAVAQVPGVLAVTQPGGGGQIIRGLADVDAAIDAVSAGAQRVALANAVPALRSLTQ